LSCSAAVGFSLVTGSDLFPKTLSARSIIRCKVKEM
jgi:hypothetical protein